MPEKILAIVSQPVSAGQLREAAGDAADDAEVMVVAPALVSRKRFLLADPDGAIERAEEIQDETVQRLVEEGVDAAGESGESDPLLAIQDTLATYPADRIIIFTHADDKSNWLEDGLVDKARERFDPPVSHVMVAGSLDDDSRPT